MSTCDLINTISNPWSVYHSFTDSHQIFTELTWTGTFLKIIGQIAFHDINQIVPCYGYCSSDSRNLWLLDTFP
jgi:hypothetical protein